jgi:hypothetical protein
MGTAIYAQSQQAAGPQPESAEAHEAQAHDDDDVVEAEIVDEDKPAEQEGGAA